MISKDTIQEVTDKIDIVEVISAFMNLKRKGQNYSGLCPFHNERTPSFSVSQPKQIFKCFGCGKSGSAITFVMEHEKMSYIEAIKWLAKHYGVDIVEEAMTQDQLVEHQQIESLYIINSTIQKIYSHQLQDNSINVVARQYVAYRGFREDTINTFQLGYASDKRSITQALLDQQFEKHWVIKSGVGVERYGELVDAYKERIIFPFHNLSGKVIGFGARIMTSIDAKNKEPKYLNTPENELFLKGKILYGLYFSKPFIVKADECVLVEGYTDVIALFQAGFKNVVSTSGTALTIEQIRLIKKFTKRITFIYDGDSAGMAASSRGMRLCVSEGMNVHILSIPDQDDPDSFIKKKGAAAFAELLQTHKKDFILFEIESKLTAIGNDIYKKNALVNEVADIIADINKLEDFTRQHFYVQKSAALMQVNEEALMQLVQQQAQQKTKKKSLPQNTPQSNTNIPQTDEQTAPNAADTEAPQDPKNDIQNDASFYLEQDLVRVLLEHGDKIFDEAYHLSVAEYLIDVCAIESDMQHPIFKNIFNLYRSLLTEEKKHPSIKIFMYHTDKTIAENTTKALLFHQYDPREEWDWKDPFAGQQPTLQNNSLLSHKILTDKEKEKETLFKKDVLSVEYYFKLKRYQKMKMMVTEGLKDHTISVEEQQTKMKILDDLKKQIQDIAQQIGLNVV